MRLILANNVNDAYVQGLAALAENHSIEDSRNGPVAVYPTPVTTLYLRPWERVLFSPLRDANPFFHVMESLWMIAGRRDVTWPATFNSTFGQFSDNGKYFHGAYGYRWRHWWVGCDQPWIIINELKKNPTSRRCVMAMWSPEGDLMPTDNDVEGGQKSKDLPCNTHIYFRVNNGKLDMTVCNRSNDVIWGAYGANAVHMSFLQEYMAAGIGIPVGHYYQMSNNYHVYLNRFPLGSWGEMSDDAQKNNRYVANAAQIEHVPFVTNFDTFDNELRLFLAEPEAGYPYENEFFLTVARPMYLAWAAHKGGVGPYSERSPLCAAEHAQEIQAEDWRVACSQWLARRNHNA